MSIRLKLILLVGVPMLLVLSMGGAKIWQSVSTAGEMARLETLVDLGVKVSSLVHETQKERGRTAGFLGSGGKKFAAELGGQRKLTQSRRADLDAYLAGFDATPFGEKFAAGLAGFRDDIAKLDAKRGIIDRLDIPLGEALGYYTAMNGKGLDLIGSIVHQSSDAHMSKQIEGYALFLKGKERAGIERAVLSGTFAGDHFKPGFYKKFVGLVTEQNTYLGEFAKVIDAKNVVSYEEAMSHPSIAEVERYRAIAFEKAATGGFGVDAAAWFATITQKINQLKIVEDSLSASLSDEAHGARRAATRTLYLISFKLLLITLAAGVGAWWCIRSIVGPMRRLITKMSLIEQSNDLTQRSGVTSNDEIGQVAKCFDTMIDTLEQIIAQVRGSCGQVAAAATEVSATSEELQRGLTSQIDRVQEIGRSVEEMAGMSQTMSTTSTEASEAAQESGEVATRGGEVVEQTVRGMTAIHDAVEAVAVSVEGLGQRSEEIGEIIAVINDIADQTNLLALNAAIEAARAGEHGRGFAVVADEVRKLADRTTKATDKIAGSIKSIQSDTGGAVERMTAGKSEVEQGVALAGQATDSLKQIVASSHKLGGQVSSIVDGTALQAESTEQVARHIGEIRTFSEQAGDGSRQAAEAAQDLSERAEELAQLVSKFKTRLG